MKKQVENKRPYFEPFADPNGIPYVEYLKTKKCESDSKFAPFPDPRGVSQEELER